MSTADTHEFIVVDNIGHIINIGHQVENRATCRRDTVDERGHVIFHSTNGVGVLQSVVT